MREVPDKVKVQFMLDRHAWAGLKVIADNRGERMSNLMIRLLTFAANSGHGAMLIPVKDPRRLKAALDDDASLDDMCPL